MFVICKNLRLEVVLKILNFYLKNYRVFFESIFEKSLFVELDFLFRLFNSIDDRE
ncbi:hypothetical protein LEP1GSC104_1648 [Leptospira interrogans str. UI 12621]|uniref:Uncharacterized protein n=1 Tax=Leptospira interrogans str. UI 12621 TaxID=1049937 RepID=A0A0F6HC83_LEPIR|nr:hypothetical protein LEP1GSC104_1648 [Leptospira interrogans str. UI 12621]